jgi:rRNA biogenesis protein RRP5
MPQQEKTPETIEDYEKLILSDHNNSKSWILYASYILDKLGYSNAKKIFDRAIQNIDISLIKEKLNIWIAYMNLENVYGDKESFKHTVERALEVNDKKTIYKHLINIYKQSGKYQMALEVYKLAMKSFFNDVNLWRNYIEFLFEAQKLNLNDQMTETEFCSPKEMLNRALQSLPQKEHIDLLIKYGQMQYKYDLVEEGRNTFESILRNYPKKSNVWTIFIDQESKYGTKEKVRNLFEKVLTVDFKIKILKNMIKKYLEFEVKFGNSKSVEHVKNITQELINKKLEELEEGDDDGDEMNVDQ